MEGILTIILVIGAIILFVYRDKKRKANKAKDWSDKGAATYKETKYKSYKLKKKDSNPPDDSEDLEQFIPGGANIKGFCYHCYGDLKMDRAVRDYYDGLEKLESEWSVMYNWNDFSESTSERFIARCKNNISAFETAVQFWRKYGEEYPKSAPAYKRLAMIYDKNGRYKDAINTCIRAIQIGAINDGTKGGMNGRLARMVKKAEQASELDENERNDLRAFIYQELED